MGGERLAPERGGLGHAGEEQVRGTARVPGGGKGDGHRTERADGRPVDVALDRPLRQWNRATGMVQRRVADAVGPRDELGLAPLPHRAPCLLLGHLRRTMADVDEQAEGPLAQGVGDRRRRGQRHVGARATDAVLEETTDAGLAVDQRDDAGHLRRDACQPQGLGRSGNTQAGDVSHQRERVALHEFGVGRVLGAVVREPLLVDLVGLFDVGHRLDEVVELERLGVEHHDRPTDHGVDLGPLHAVERLQCRLHIADEPGTRRVVGTPDFDVRPAVLDAGTPLHPAFGVAEPGHGPTGRGQRVEGTEQVDHQRPVGAADRQVSSVRPPAG